MFAKACNNLVLKLAMLDFKIGCVWSNYMSNAIRKSLLKYYVAFEITN
jgi:hypothetical protein